MNNTGKILLASGAAAVLVAGTIHVVKTSNTADKLDIILESFSIKKQGLKGLGLSLTIPKIVFNADLKINNPTDNDLVIGKPYLKVFYQNGVTPIGVSNASNQTYTLKAKQSTPVSVDVEFSALSVLSVMPDFVKYIASRFSGKPSSRKVTIEMLTSGNGINQTERTEVAI